MGILWSFLQQLFPPAPTYTIDDIPDLSGKVMIVTGGNAGIGKETVKALLVHNAKVYIASRTQEKAEGAITDLKEQTGKEAYFLELDLADLRSVKAAAEEFQRHEKELHVLFNNAGIYHPPIEHTTAQGYDLQFGTNTLGEEVFSLLLLPTLLSTAKTSQSGTVRVVNIASFAQGYARPLNFNTFKDSTMRRKLSSEILYAQSKLGNVIFSSELARRYGDQGVVSISLHPGFLRSGIIRHLRGINFVLADFVLHHPLSLGALTQLWAGTSPEGSQFNGKYLIPWARMGKCTPLAEDPETGKELWKWFEEQVQDT